MFEVGEMYDITILEWSDSELGPVRTNRQVAAEVDGTLVKFITPARTVKFGGVEQYLPERCKIVNTASLYFVSAEPSNN